MATHRNRGRLTEAPAQPGPAQPGSAQPGPGHPIPAEPDPAQPDESPHAPLAESLARVGDRWTLLLVAALLEGPKRFGDLQQELPGIAPNVLTQRLRQLERNALILARPYSRRPPRFVYELTTAGRELADVVRLLAGWGARNAGGDAAPRHSVCGTPMEVRWWCPTCEQAVSEDGEELHFA